MGKDPWHRSFHGKLKNFNLAFGPGAFKTGDFDTLRTTPARPLAPRDSLFTNTYIQEYQKPTVLVEQEFEPEELNGLKEYGVSFYYRWSQRMPVYIRNMGEYYSGCFILMRMNDAYRQTMGIWYCPMRYEPGIFFDTYGLANGDNRGEHFAFDTQDLEGVWNFFHFTYSYE